ncbi:hypothetical protein [Peptacetobacter sp.]|uniref:hypothetical protein n=1 Tax=Peptacetobacter sp. TaxID=2991975 RepID=UPI00260C5838|nr:hypothetical protein [Peptacetobacter sp.]
MFKKFMSILASLFIIFSSTFANVSAEQTKGKVIFINMSRTNLENMMSIKEIKMLLEKEGYVGLMNIKGDQGNDDARSLATMGATGRSTIAKFDDKDAVDFIEPNKVQKKEYETSTGKKAKKIVNMESNRTLNENIEKGEFESTLGVVGQVLSENGYKTSVIGNSDYNDYNGNLVKNRNIAFAAMDNFGRIDDGNIENINIKDTSMPFGISTDYKKLKEDTKRLYKNTDAIYVDLGDTYRLDEYKMNLNKNTYEKMKFRTYSRINSYLKEVFSMINEKDTVYIVSAFPSNLDYSNKKRFSPIIKYSKSEKGKGLLTSPTTRRDGIVANMDIGVDILNNFGLSNEMMLGRTMSNIKKENNIEFLEKEYEKINSIALIRAGVVNTFVGVVSASWVAGLVAVLISKRIPKKYKGKIFNILKELIKFGIIMPLSFMIAPIFNFSGQISMSICVIAVTLLIYIVSKTLFKEDDLKQMGFIALVTILLIAVDAVFGTYLMKNNIMSYDAMVGARYYGIGNEYEGVTIGSAVFAFAVLLYYKKIPKLLSAVAFVIILITSAYPSMGANVGGAISESAAYMLFILLMYNIKVDWKKALGIIVAVACVVIAFAFMDISSGSPSHLGLFVQQIMLNGPGEVILMFTRKIQMNVKLAQTSVWVNILIAGIVIIASLIFKPNKHFRFIAEKYPIVFKGFIASMIGCIITLLVNDSGIVAASTASIYILIPVMVISINMVLKDSDKEKIDADR